jgi:hypothetical protein
MCIIMNSCMFLINLFTILKFGILYMYSLFFITCCNGGANSTDNTDQFSLHLAHFWEYGGKASCINLVSFMV